MFKIAQSGTNFLDSLYNQNMQTQKAQADLQYSLARTRSLNTDTDYNEKANQYRIDDLDMANQIKKATLDDTIEKSHLSRQQELENLHHSQNQNPQLEEELRQKNVQAGILTDEMKSQQQRNQQALDEWPMARADLNINPDDPDFEDKLVQFYRNHPNVATNLATKPMVDIQVKALESARSNLASVTEANNNAKTMMAMKATGDLPADTNIDALKANPDVAHQTIVRGNVTAQQRRISEILSAIGPNPPPELRTQADDLRNAQNRLSTILGAPDGINQVANGAWSQFFDANGRLNAGLEGDISAMQTYAQERAKQGLAKPMSTTVTVKGGDAANPSEIRVENVPAGQEQTVTRQMQEAFKTEEQRAQEKAGLQKNAQVKQTNDVADLMRNNPEIKALSEEAARTGNWTKVQDAINKQLTPAQQTQPAKQEGVPENKQSSVEEGRIRTSNNDYTYPHGAADVAGIDRNVWANAMSEEGAEPGLDPGTNHMSVFGLWRDKPGAEGDAYRTAIQNGPRSLEAYNAVTQTWAKWAADSKANPWELDSPGMQELVLADVQHTGGSARVRQAIDSMGGFEAINKMDPGEAIRQYSRLRLSFWPGNAGRVQREGQWALQNDTTLRGAGRVAKMQGGGLVSVAKMQPGGLVSGAAGPDQVPAMLTSGEYVVNKDAVQNVGLQTLEALNAGTRQDPKLALNAGTQQDVFGQVSNQSSVSNAPLFPPLPTIRPQLAQTSTPAPRAMPAQTPAPRAQPAQTPAVTTGAATSPIASTGGTTLTPQYTTGDAFLNAHYLGDGRLSGLTTNFGHDVNGRPDTYMLSKLGGGSRLGAFGTDVVNPTTAGVSLPEQTFRAFIGDPKNKDIRQRVTSGQVQVEVTAPNGRTGRFNIVDLGPGKGEHASLDMTGTAMRQLGMKDNFGAVYRIVSY
jgi:hypothetical protein